MTTAHGGQMVFCPAAGCKLAEGSWENGFGRKDNLNGHMSRQHAGVKRDSEMRLSTTQTSSLALEAQVEHGDPLREVAADPEADVSIEAENTRLRSELEELKNDLDLPREYHEEERRVLIAALIKELRKEADS
jgi:hypothetical protein